MRLHRLELTAFGPFAGTQHVDFDELSAAGLFLLHGPTGAGKTSVLDAVCYALYGQVPGARPATRLRSDHAAPGTSTEVVLEFTVGGRRLEITRRPEQPRAKRRGTGTTMDKAVTLLRERHAGGEWRGLSTSHQEIGEEIRQLLGMSCEQFCQVVLLPQGEFATFLRAGAVERGALLGRLFDTRRFKAVENWLRDRRQQAAQRLAQGDEDLRQLAARTRQAAGLGEDPDLGEAEPDDAAHLLATAAVLRCDAREQLGVARSAVTLAEAAHDAASAAATAARELHALQRRHREARDRAAAIALEAPARAATRARLDRAHRALTVEPALTQREKAATQHADTLAAEREITGQLAGTNELPPPSRAFPAPRSTGDAEGAGGRGADARRGGSAAGEVDEDEGAGGQAGDVAEAVGGRGGDAWRGGSVAGEVDEGDVAEGAGGRGGDAWRGGSAALGEVEEGVGAGGQAGDVAESAGGRGGDARRGGSAALGEMDEGEVARGQAGDGAEGAGGRGGDAWRGGSAAAGVGAEGEAGDGGEAAGGLGRRRPGAQRDGVSADRVWRGGSVAGQGGDGSEVAVGRAASRGDETGESPKGAVLPGGGPGRQGGIGGAGRGPGGDVLPAGSRQADETSTSIGRQAGPAGIAAGADELACRAGELREEVGGLAAGEAAEGQVREIQERLRALEWEERGDEEAVREAELWLEGWPQVRRELQARVDDGGEAAARAAALAGEVEAARRRRDAARERDALADELTRAEDAARDARDRVAGAREAWQDLREIRITGIAAELAAELVDGEACRVCGADQHPDPARPAQRHVTRADEDAAYDDFQHQQSEYERAQGDTARLRAALDAATATAGDAPHDELAVTHAESAAAHAAATREAAGVPEARTALTRAEEERDRRTVQRQSALSRAAARTSRREELEEQQGRLAAELDRARAGYVTVRARRERLTARIALLDRAVHAVRDRAESSRRLAEADAALADAAGSAGFDSPREAAAALLPPAQLWDAERRTQAWAKEEAAIEADLAAREPAEAAALAPADPDAAQEILEAAHRRLRDASSAESAAVTRCRELDELAAQSTARVRELAPARADFARLKRLSDLTSGTSTENQYRMELETYVLAARLEQVAAAAGVRLQRMSAGRYTLVHSDARSGGRARSGLGLMVVDAWTGTERDTATLSGGETFFASLALALGLADVVTDEAGGIRLDTLFIDEGFGSLDEQTLDEVLDVLDGLRERDRAVGIVSHVADLRHRIPAQLRVVKGRDGSSVRLRAGAAVY